MVGYLRSLEQVSGGLYRYLANSLRRNPELNQSGEYFAGDKIDSVWVVASSNESVLAGIGAAKSSVMRKHDITCVSIINQLFGY